MCSANDIIVAVTDGILDAGARDENVRTFGSLGVVSRVSNVLHKNTDARPKDIADAIFEKARQHGTIHDDATILVIRMAQMTSGLAGPNRKIEKKRHSLAEN
jgi:serine phosphatase RsbU (regulator of sigma subunit)